MIAPVPILISNGMSFLEFSKRSAVFVAFVSRPFDAMNFRTLGVELIQEFELHSSLVGKTCSRSLKLRKF